MKNIVVSFLGALVFCSAGIADEGSKPYSPTRIEWLMIQARSGCNFPSNPDFHVVVTDYHDSYTPGIGIPKTKPDTIFITGYLDNATFPMKLIEAPENYRSAIEGQTIELAKVTMTNCKNLILEMARLKGWNSWLKIEMNEEGIKYGQFDSLIKKVKGKK